MQHPFTCLVSGPTGSGKTSLVKEIIAQNVIEPHPQHILWLYAEDQPLYKSMKNVIFHQGIPDDIEERFNPRVINLLIIDDLMTKCHSDERMTRLFSVGSSHKNLSIIFIVHNLFHYGREMRSISLNSHYIILFKNPRDNQQVRTLGSQMYPGRSRFFIEAFQDVTAKPHGYIFIDLKPKTPDIIRVRGGILPEDKHIVYIGEQSIQTPLYIDVPSSQHVSEKDKGKRIISTSSRQKRGTKKKKIARAGNKGRTFKLI